MKSALLPSILTLLALLLVQALYANARAEYSREYAVKAAMIRNFAKFTRWPESPDKTTKEKNLSICLMGDESLLEAFAGIQGRKVKGRSIELHWINNISGLQGCDILFVGHSSPTEFSRIMNSLRHKSVLTIGETTQFTKAGGMIAFFSTNGRIRFQINPVAVRHAGLQLSSTLLELATIVQQP